MTNKQRLLILAGGILFALAIAAFGGREYGKTVFYGDVSMGTWTALESTASNGVYDAAGIYTNSVRTNYYRLAYTNLLGRGPGTQVTVAFAGNTNTSSTTGTNAVQLRWAPKGGAASYIIEKSHNLGSTWTNWIPLGPTYTNWTDTGTNIWTAGAFTSVYPLISAPTSTWLSAAEFYSSNAWLQAQAALSLSNRESIKVFDAAGIMRSTWSTNLTAALAVATNGDTVLVGPGQYYYFSESEYINLPSNVSFVGAGPEATRLTFSDGSLALVQGNYNDATNTFVNMSVDAHISLNATLRGYNCVFNGLSNSESLVFLFYSAAGETGRVDLVDCTLENSGPFEGTIEMTSTRTTWGDDVIPSGVSVSTTYAPVRARDASLTNEVPTLSQARGISTNAYGAAAAYADNLVQAHGTNQFSGPGSTGHVTAVATDTNKYLRGDGTWSAPAGAGDFLADGTIPMSGPLNLGGQRATNAADAVAEDDLVTRRQAKNASALTNWPAYSTPTVIASGASNNISLAGGPDVFCQVTNASAVFYVPARQTNYHEWFAMTILPGTNSVTFATNGFSPMVLCTNPVFNLRAGDTNIVVIDGPYNANVWKGWVLP